MIRTHETAEERIRRLGNIEQAALRFRKTRLRRVFRTLEAAMGAGPMSLRELRQMVEQEYETPVVSLYLNFSPDRLVRADRPIFLSIFESLRQGELQRRKSYLESLTRPQRNRLEDDLAEISLFLENYRPTGARSIALFKSGEQLLRGLSLSARSADALTIDRDPYTEPLEGIMEANRRVLVIELSKEAATLSVYHLGVEEVIDTISAPAGTGSVQSKRPEDIVERRDETHLHWHFESVARLAARVFRERDCELVALVGEAVLLEAFDDFLPKALKDKLIVEINASPGDSRPQWLPAVGKAVDRLRSDEEAAAIGELGWYRAHGRLAAGMESVIEPVNQLLARRLFIRGDLRQPGWICRTHHYLSLEPGQCVFDGAELLPVENIADELIEVARLHGMDVMVVSKRPELLDPFGGVAVVTLPPPPS
jgi:release factor family 10